MLRSFTAPLWGFMLRQDPPGGGGGAPPADPPAPPPPADPPAPPAPPAGDPPPADPPAPPNSSAAAERLRRKAEKERDDALQRLKELEDAGLDEKTRAERERDEAKREAAEATERATKAEVRSRLVLRAGAKTSAGQAAIDLSEAKLVDLKDSSDEELDAHLDEVVAKYQLPGPAAGGAPTSFGQPAGGGAPPAGGGGGQHPDAPGPDPATGEPEKDYRAGVGLGILSMLGGRSRGGE